jgi:hypothetical protein
VKLGKLIPSLMLLFIPVPSVSFQDQVSVLPQGVCATDDPSSLPLPTSGYQVYLVGEAHGNQETKALFLGYLSRLYRGSSLRDVFLEEDQVYEEEAQAFVRGSRNDLPVGLCLRTDILSGLREFNRNLPVDEQIRVHLIDIDSPEEAIRQHLLRLKNRIGISAENLQISDQEALSVTGTRLLVERLADLTSDRDILAGLRTVRQSLIAYDEGFRSHIGPVQGNPAHPAREEAITANLLDVSRAAQPAPVLGLYGWVHVRRGTRPFPDGAGGTFMLTPMADRLETAGIKVYRAICYPLSGRLLWRRRGFELPAGPGAVDFKLSDGGTIKDILGRAPGSEFILLDFAKGIRLRTEDEDLSEHFDSYVFLRTATPMKDQCPSN